MAPMIEVTTNELQAAAAQLVMLAARVGELDELERGPTESLAVYVARLSHYAATMLEGK